MRTSHDAGLPLLSPDEEQRAITADQQIAQNDLHGRVGGVT